VEKFSREKQSLIDSQNK